MDARSKKTHAVIAVCWWLAASACGTDPLSLPESEIVEADAGAIDDGNEPVDLAMVTDLGSIPMTEHDIVDLESEGHDVVALEHLPNVGPAEDSVVDAEEVPPRILRELREQTIEKAIVGADSRTPVRNSRVAPYSAVVQVLSQWLKGKAAVPCTGTMVARDAVLTAAHCIYNSSRTATGFPYSVSVAPGLYPKSPRPASGILYNAPFGVGYAKKLFVPDRFKANNRDPWTRIPSDYAIIRLKAPIANVAVRPIGVLENVLAQPTVLDAYHEDKQDCLQMHESKDKVRKVIDDGSFNHFTDLKPGASGGGIVGTGAWANKIFGVQSSHINEGNRYNIAATITVDKYRSISSWVNRAL